MAEIDSPSTFHGLAVHLDPAPADWIVLALEKPFVGESGFTIASLLPPNYDGYVRIFHPAGPHRWAEVAKAAGREMHPAVQFTKLLPSPRPDPYYNADFPQPHQGTLEPRTREALTSILLEHTTTPDAGWFCLWDGWGGGPQQALAYGAVRAWARRYILLSGPVSAVERFSDGPQIWWPADRAWCVASEIDFDSTVVAGSGRMLDALVQNPGLEALRVDRQTRLDYLGDEVNAGTMTEAELERLRQQL
jgi:hypothetical protein